MSGGVETILALFLIVLPVFLTVGLGYATVRLKVFPVSAIDALIAFATTIAVPALLFRSIYALDLGAAIRLGHLVSFYGAAVACFAGAILVFRYAWRRRPGESVAIGFSALFSNSVLLGLPVFTRAYGEDALEPVFAIVAFHAMLCYLIGIVTMEVARRDGGSLLLALRRSVAAIFRNALTIGIVLGFAFNLGRIPVPDEVMASVDMLATAALPVALFGLGGVLTRYAMRAEIGQALTIAAFSLVVHPALAWLLAERVFALPEGFVRAAVLIAAMPPGVNGYIFAAMYGRMVGTAASTVLLSTVLSLVSITVWLYLLGGAALG